MTKHVLLIEDDQPYLDVMAKTLEKVGYRVSTRENGTEGEVRIKEMEPDLVLLDVMLPGKNGFDICSDLKADPAYQHIPIIMLTSLTELCIKDDSFWCEDTGADDFMTKPFPMEELVVRVKKILAET